MSMPRFADSISHREGDLKNQGKSRPSLTDRATGGLLALACGDALANGAEYNPRGSYTIVGMHSGPRFLPPGQWSDDTGLALCLADSFLSLGDFDPVDQMRRYSAFYDGGAGWPLSIPLVPGQTTRQALRQFKLSGEPFSGSTNPVSAGNGGLMRLLPAVLAAYPDAEKARRWARESTRTTHAAAECLEASEVLGMILYRLLQGEEKGVAVFAARDQQWRSPRIQALAEGRYMDKRVELVSAKAYVIDTLEAALWCFATTETLAAALLNAANLGDDCDTVAAITGQLAGCNEGACAIPEEWLAVLVEREAIERRALGLIALRSSPLDPPLPTEENHVRTLSPTRRSSCPAPPQRTLKAHSRPPSRD